MDAARNLNAIICSYASRSVLQMVEKGEPWPDLREQGLLTLGPPPCCPLTMLMITLFSDGVTSPHRADPLLIKCDVEPVPKISKGLSPLPQSLLLVFPMLP